MVDAVAETKASHGLQDSVVDSSLFGLGELRWEEIVQLAKGGRASIGVFGSFVTDIYS